MSKRTKTYRPRQKVRGPVVNPYAGPPKAELRKQVEAAMASGSPGHAMPCGKENAAAKTLVHLEELDVDPSEGRFDALSGGCYWSKE